LLRERSGAKKDGKAELGSVARGWQEVDKGMEGSGSEGEK